jgi:hypothetical protein
VMAITTRFLFVNVLSPFWSGARGFHHTLIEARPMPMSEGVDEGVELIQIKETVLMRCHQSGDDHEEAELICRFR